MNECCQKGMSITLGMDGNNTPVRVDLEKITHLMVGGGDKNVREAWTTRMIKELDVDQVMFIKTLQELQKTAVDAENKLQMMRNAGCCNRNDYTLKTGEIIKPIVCVVESAAEWMDVYETKINACMRILGPFGRHAGVHLVWLCNTPLPNMLKCYFPGRIAFKTKNEEESVHILDMTGAEKLADEKTFLFTADGEIAQLIYA